MWAAEGRAVMLPLGAASPMPVRHISSPPLDIASPSSRIGQPLPRALARTMHPQAVSDDQHPVQLHSEQPQKPPVVSPGLLSGDKLAVPAFQTATAGLRSEPCPAHGRAQLPRQLPVGRSLSGAKAKAQAGLLLGSVSTPVNGPCSVTGLQQLPQQLSQAVAPRPHVSRPQLVVGRPQQTLGPQLGQQQTTFVTSQNARLQHLCRPAADLSAGNNTIQATAPAVEITPQQSPAQCGQDEACLQQLIRTARFVNDKSARLLYSSRGHQFDEALGQFFADILAVCARTESRVNHIHLTAILGGLAKAWATAKACHVVHNHQQAGNDLHRFTAKILEMLQPLCKTLGVREASSLLSSLSKLNTDPGLLVPGTLDAIVQQLMANMHSANGQDLADVTAALTMLQSTPCYKDLMLAVSSQLAGGGLSNADSTRVASILHSLATTPSAAHSTKALNALCERFSVQLRSHRLADLPYANSIAIVMWALSKLKHAPSNELAMSMVGRMADLCRSPKQQPLPQAISNVLLACAELRISVKQADIDSLVSPCKCTQRQALSSLQGKLHRLGARPAPPKCHLSDDGKLCGALKQLQLPFRSPVFIRGYWADAVLDSPGNKAQPIILTVSRPDYIRNIPGRLTGRAMFRIHLLAKQGRLVDVPHDMTCDPITVQQLADHLEPILTAAAGGSLNAYRI
ncbi:MAG: hypothetical protein FRX49_12688 [Trebouxia sp. A1-2]|nr:MAG: hypothetical protein FRX49_12688 [Trebouxia sp. A1-2]